MTTLIFSVFSLIENIQTLKEQLGNKALSNTTPSRHSTKNKEMKLTNNKKNNPKSEEKINK